MIIDKFCPIDGKTYSIDVPITLHEYAEGIKKYQDGEMIQHAFPTLAPKWREYILTGIPPEVWDEMFKFESEEFDPEKE